MIFLNQILEELKGSGALNKFFFGNKITKIQNILFHFDDF
jgi:hypothetical protein